MQTSRFRPTGILTNRRMEDLTVSIDPLKTGIAMHHRFTAEIMDHVYVRTRIQLVSGSAVLNEYEWLSDKDVDLTMLEPATDAAGYSISWLTTDAERLARDLAVKNASVDVCIYTQMITEPVVRTNETGHVIGVSPMVMRYSEDRRARRLLSESQSCIAWRNGAVTPEGQALLDKLAELRKNFVTSDDLHETPDLP